MPLSKIEVDGDNITYVYAIDTEARLSDARRKSPLYISGMSNAICLTKTQGRNMANREVYCKDDIFAILEKQRNSDLRFREMFEEAHDTSDWHLSTFEVAKKSQSLEGAYVVRALEISDSSIVFVGRR